MYVLEIIENNVNIFLKNQFYLNFTFDPDRNFLDLQLYRKRHKQFKICKTLKCSQCCELIGKSSNAIGSTIQLDLPVPQSHRTMTAIEA